VSTTLSIQWAALSIIVGVIREPKFKHIFCLSKDTKQTLYELFQQSSFHPQPLKFINNQHDPDHTLLTIGHHN